MDCIVNFFAITRLDVILIGGLFIGMPLGVWLMMCMDKKMSNRKQTGDECEL
jgi:uncharacterized membrane protein